MSIYIYIHIYNSHIRFFPSANFIASDLKKPKKKNQKYRPSSGMD